MSNQEKNCIADELYFEFASDELLEETAATLQFDPQDGAILPLIEKSL